MIIIMVAFNYVLYIFHCNMSRIFEYCSSLSPTTSVASSILNQHISYFLFLKAPPHPSLPLQTLVMIESDLT